MEVVDEILSDWRACRPDGVILRAAQIGCVIDRVVARVERYPPAARRDAYALLTPGEASEDGGTPGLPPLVRQLRIDSGYRYRATAGKGGVGDTVEGIAVVHFLRFWQALQEVARRLQASPSSSSAAAEGVDVQEDEEEPVAEELSAFRDALLRIIDGGSLTPSRLSRELRRAREMSADEDAWAPLVASISYAPAGVSHSPTPAKSAAKAAEQLPKPPVLPCVADPSINPAQDVEKPLQLDEVSMLLQGWLLELTEDYCRGGRSTKIRVVQDVSGCSRRNACLHLGAGGWDIESALRSFFGGVESSSSSSLCDAGMPWSSNGMRLRRSEVQCPICIAPYDANLQIVSMRCCFQSLCSDCVNRLTSDDGSLRCPFCRIVERYPSRLLRPEKDRSCNVPIVVLAADLASEATRLFGGFASALCTLDRSNIESYHLNPAAIYRPSPGRLDQGGGDSPVEIRSSGRRSARSTRSTGQSSEEAAPVGVDGRERIITLGPPPRQRGATAPAEATNSIALPPCREEEPLPRVVAAAAGEEPASSSASQSSLPPGQQARRPARAPYGLPPGVSVRSRITSDWRNLQYA